MNTSILLTALRDGRWHKARTLTDETGVNDRALRRMAEKLHGLVIGSDKGYKLTSKATRAEVDASLARMESQIKKNRMRIDATRECHDRANGKHWAQRELERHRVAGSAVILGRLITGN